MGSRKSRQFHLRNGEFGAVQIFERIAEMDEHQIAFVPEHGIHGGGLRVAAFAAGLHGRQCFGGVLHNPVAMEHFLLPPFRRAKRKI